MTEPSVELPAEDATLVTLARGARARVDAASGAAVRDTDGRKYSCAEVDLPSLSLSALRLAVAMAASAGARGLEAATTDAPDVAPADLDAVRDLAGPDVPVLLVDVRGRLRETLRT